MVRKMRLSAPIWKSINIRHHRRKFHQDMNNSYGQNVPVAPGIKINKIISILKLSSFKVLLILLIVAIMYTNKQVAKQLKVARKSNISPLYAVSPYLLHSGMQSGDLVLLPAIAMGSPSADLYTNFHGMYWIANALASELKATRVSDQIVKSKMYGEMFASWCYKQHDGNRVAEARMRVKELLDNNVPENTQVTAAIESLLKSVANLRGGVTAALGETDLYLSTQIAGSINYQRIVFFQNRGNLLSKIGAIIQDTDVKSAYDSLMRFETGFVPIPPLENLQIAYPTNWYQNGDWEVQLGCHEMMVAAAPTKFHEEVVCGSLVAIYSLVKGGNFTEAWLARRLAQVASINSFFDFQAAITPDLMKTFEGLYPKDNLTTQQLYRTLIATYAISADTNTQTIKWVIEQSLSSNITAALTFAEVMTSMQYINLESLIVNIGENEFRELINLICHVVHDPYCTLISPPVPMRSYANIAYVALKIYKLQTGVKPNQYTYAGTPLAYLTRAAAELDKMCEVIHEISLSATEEHSTLFGQLSLANPDHIVLEGSAGFYLVPKEAAIAEQSDAIGAGEESVIVTQMRSAWDKKMKNLPKTTRMMTREAAATSLVRGETERAVALKVALGALKTASVQKGLEVGDGAVLPPRGVKLPTALTDAARLWAVPIKSGWMSGVLDEPRNPDFLSDLGFHNTILLSRWLGDYVTGGSGEVITTRPELPSPVARVVQPSPYSYQPSTSTSQVDGQSPSRSVLDREVTPSTSLSATSDGGQPAFVFGSTFLQFIDYVKRIGGQITSNTSRGLNVSVGTDTHYYEFYSYAPNEVAVTHAKVVHDDFSESALDIPEEVSFPIGRVRRDVDMRRIIMAIAPIAPGEGNTEEDN